MDEINEFPSEYWTELCASDRIRKKRDELLSASDYIMMPDYDVDAGLREQYVNYRQALRDITEQPGFPFDITWPERP